MPARTTPRRTLVALCMLLALVASACAGTTVQTEELNASSLQPDSASEPVPWNVDPTVAPLPDEAASITNGAEAAADRSVGAVVPATEVLALAFTAPEELSYTFTQGISMEMDMPGIGAFSIAPTEAIAHGEVDGTRNHIVMDMGVLFTEMFASLGGGSELANEFDGLTMEMWSDESVLVMDMSSFAATMGAIDPMTGSEFDLLANGPVLIDLSQAPGLTGAEFASQYAQGTQVVDPALLLQSLRSVDAIRSVGSMNHDGRSVEVYDATITMADYYEALGIDISAQLDTMGGLGLTAEDDAFLLAIIDAMSGLPVELRIMIDEDQLIRRLETTIDMQPLMAAMFEDPDMLAALAAAEGATAEEMAAGADLMAGMRYTVGTWQEFENYGGAFEITFPEATDITMEFADLFAELS